MKFEDIIKEEIVNTLTQYNLTEEEAKKLADKHENRISAYMWGEFDSELEKLINNKTQEKE